jgi:hypothetical protein
MELPDELWRLIKDFQIEYKKHHINKLKIVHDELLKNRPMYLKKFIAYQRMTYEQAWEFSWVNFVRDNQTIDAYDNSHYPKPKLHLHAIEVLPWNNHQRLFLSNIVLYYGWCRDKDREGEYAPLEPGGYLQPFPHMGYY